MSKPKFILNSSFHKDEFRILPPMEGPGQVLWESPFIHWKHAMNNSRTMVCYGRSMGKTRATAEYQEYMRRKELAQKLHDAVMSGMITIELAGDIVDQVRVKELDQNLNAQVDIETAGLEQAKRMQSYGRFGHQFPDIDLDNDERDAFDALRYCFTSISDPNKSSAICGDEDDDDLMNNRKQPRMMGLDEQLREEERLRLEAETERQFSEYGAGESIVKSIHKDGGFSVEGKVKECDHDWVTWTNLKNQTVTDCTKCKREKKDCE